MSPDKQGPGIPIHGELTRREYDILMLIAKKLKHERNPFDSVRWLIEYFGTGYLPFTTDGAEARSLLREQVGEIHYPESVSVSTSRGADKD